MDTETLNVAISSWVRQFLTANKDDHAYLMEESFIELLRFDQWNKLMDDFKKVSDFLETIDNWMVASSELMYSINGYSQHQLEYAVVSLIDEEITRQLELKYQTTS